MIQADFPPKIKYIIVEHVAVGVMTIHTKVSQLWVLTHVEDDSRESYKALEISAAGIVFGW